MSLSVFLHNLLPDVPPIALIDTNPAAVRLSNVRTTKDVIIHFAIAPGNTGIYETESDHFRAKTELLDRSSTEGLVKVSSIIDQETIHLLFTGLTKLLNFQLVLRRSLVVTSII